MELETLREKLADILLRSEEPLSASELARMLDLDPRRGVRMVYEMLPHVSKSIRARYGKQVYFEPPTCRKCGFTFSSFKKPHKCPKCGSEWIEPPRFFVR